jgi:hypothetical protein
MGLATETRFVLGGAMSESSLYQAILQEGEARGKVKDRRDALLRVLELRFQAPVPTDLAVMINTQDDLAVLLRWFDLAVTCTALDDFRAGLSQAPH